MLYQVYEVKKRNEKGGKYVNMTKNLIIHKILYKL